MNESQEELCSCAICCESLYRGDMLAERLVYKNGELQYIELAHRDCARLSADKDSWGWGEDVADEHDQFQNDVEADADVLRSAGMGTDEDYGCFSEYDHLERDWDEAYEPDCREE